MEGASVGLTCREAWEVFSLNETLALQKRVIELERRLCRYEARTFSGEVDASALLRNVRAMFSLKNPEATREAPVSSEEHTTTPLLFPSTSVWCRLNSTTPETQKESSLQHSIEVALLEVFGSRNAAFCCQEADSAIVAAQHALLGGYMTAQWPAFSVVGKQEYVVWQALLDHFAELRRRVALANKMSQTE